MPRPLVPAYVSSSSLSRRAAMAFFSHGGTGAPIDPAFSMTLPTSASRYHTVVMGHRSTV